MAWLEKLYTIKSKYLTNTSRKHQVKFEKSGRGRAKEGALQDD